MINGFLNLPWFLWAGIALIIAVTYSFVWPHNAVSETTGFRFFILRWGHALTWILLAINFLLRGIDPSLSDAANLVALAGGLTYLLFIMMILIFNKKNKNNENKATTKVELGGKLRPTGRLVAQKISNDDSETIRVADDHSRSSATDLDNGRSLTQSIQGQSSENETGTLDTCIILIQRLNQLGAHWGNPICVENQNSNVDCEAYDGIAHLQIQVVRPPIKEIWQNLGQSGFANLTRNLEEAANDLRLAIRKKEKSQRSNIILAINAVDTPGYAVSAVTETFRKKYGGEVTALGFVAIWVVGPVVELVTRLDIT